ncbi:hypothetical protein M2306_001559 [Myroides gitamensis]|nr:hypothetical protein [Myroides odoratus]MDH6600865.1 hypothetical protein [Myroides gitamensis]
MKMERKTLIFYYFSNSAGFKTIDYFLSVLFV